MLNIFFINGVIWSVIFLSYLLGFSDLCMPLNTPVMFFVISIIVVSFILGFFFRRYFEFKKISNNPHKRPYITVALLVFFLVEFIIEGYIPIANVIQGKSMYEQSFVGLPFFHVLMSSLAIFYLFYLFYLFLCFNKKTILIEYICLFSIFVLLFQRQNIMILLFVDLWMFLGSIDFKSFSIGKKFLTLSGTFFLILVFLYLFGGIGNVRYGSEIGAWNNSDMIVAVGRINDKFPSFIPKQFAWAYTYLVSPLSNLNYNYAMGIEKGVDFLHVICEFLPETITKRISNYQPVKNFLIEQSLNVCTAYSKISRYLGMFGMYLLMLVEFGAVILVLHISKRYDDIYIPTITSMGYFLFLSFFVNPFVYVITFMCLMYPMCVAAFRFGKKVFSEKID